MLRTNLIIILFSSMTMTEAVTQQDLADPDARIQRIYCEGEQANLACPNGKFITIRLANYGRFTLALCNPTHRTDLSTTCQNDITLTILKLNCNDKQSYMVDIETSCFGPDLCPEVPKYLETVYPCLEVSTNYLGDPCPDTEKYLDIEYECTARAPRVLTTTAPTAFTITETPKWSLLISEFDPSLSTIAETVKPQLERIVGRQSCESVTERDIDWPLVENGASSRMSCPIGSTGYAEWICKKDGRWDPNGPDLSRCISTWSKGLLLDAEEAEDPADRLEYLNEIQQRTRRESLLGGDLITLSRAINLLIPNTIFERDADKFVELVVESVTNMAKKSQSLAWRDLKRAKRRKVVDILMKDIEQVSVAISPLITPISPRIIMKPNIELEFELSNVRVHDYVSFPSMSLYQNIYDTISIPKEALTLRNSAVDQAKVLYVAYSSLSDYLEPEPHQNNDGVAVARQVVSKIVSASLINNSNKIQTIEHLQAPVIITFLTENRRNLSSPQCVWWNSARLQWSSYGCMINLHNATHTVCHCNHMTYYAVLMDLHYQELSVDHNVALTFITYAGCTLSMICLVLSLLAFQCFSSCGGDRIFIHKNLSFSLLTAEVVFLGGIWQTSDPLYCGIIAVILHYFFLTAFSWMLLEGFELYYMLVEVFQSKYSKKPYLFLFGYGFPLAVVALSLWFDRFSYGTERYCWLRSDNFFILAFVGPVAVILICNTVFLVMTVFIVCSHSPVGYTLCKQDRDAFKNVRTWLKGSVALVALLGLTWAFGLLWINKQSIFMAYAFSVMNSLQGLFIFLFHVAFNDRMCKDYRKWVKHSFWMPDCMRDNYSHASRTMPFLPTNSSTKTGQAVSSSSLPGSDLLYPSVSDKSPTTTLPHVVAAIDSRYNNSVQMLLTQQRCNASGVYDYATISHEDHRTSSSFDYHQPQLHFQLKQQQQQQKYCINCISPVSLMPNAPDYATALSPNFRSPPNFPPPPPPPISPPSASLLVGHSLAPIPSVKITRVSDDSAYSDSSASTMQYQGEVVTSSSGVLLRMDLSKNPPVYVQGL